MMSSFYYWPNIFSDTQKSHAFAIAESKEKAADLVIEDLFKEDIFAPYLFRELIAKFKLTEDQLKEVKTELKKLLLTSELIVYNNKSFGVYVNE